MASSFLLELDTTAPSLAVDGKRDVGEGTLVHLDIDFGDAIELRVWGDINPDGEENANYGENEAGAPWFVAESPLVVRLADVDDPELHISARDDVWNVATVVKAFPSLEPPPITPAPVRPGAPGLLPPKPTERRTLKRRVRPYIRTRHSLEARQSRRTPTRTRSRRSMRSEGPGHRETVRHATLRTRSARQSWAGLGRSSSLRLGRNILIDRRPTDPDLDALIALGLFP